MGVFVPGDPVRLLPIRYLHKVVLRNAENFEANERNRKKTVIRKFQITKHVIFSWAKQKIVQIMTLPTVIGAIIQEQRGEEVLQ